MANEVTINMQASVPVKNKDVEVVVKDDSGKLGTLLISKGNIEWVPTGNSINKKRMSWAKFSDFMEDHGRSVKAKK